MNPHFIRFTFISFKKIIFFYKSKKKQDKIDHRLK